MDAIRLRALLDVSRSLVTQLDPEAVLRRLLDVAREQTGARYAAIGVLDPSREGLERFVTAGIHEAAHAAIGDLPRGRGVLGVLISDPKPLRLSDVGDHARSYGFPAGHPPMRTFLGVPIVIRGEVWGNLYLTEKAEGAAFTETDEEVAIVLADWAAIALGNARSYRSEQDRRRELERANRALETTTELSRALGGVTDVDEALGLVVKRSRALLGARVAELAVHENGDFVIRAIAGPGVGNLVGTRVPMEDSLAIGGFRTGSTERFDEVPAGTFAHQVLGGRRAVSTPLVFKGRSLGFLMVLDRIEGEERFTAGDARLLEAFAASAATALATAQSATDQALRRAIEASEHERRRWARELHDETLQELAGLRVLLSSARRTGDPDQLAAAVDEATDLIGMGVANLRALITDLRPASLDALGVQDALEALLRRVATSSGLEIEKHLDMAWERGDAASRLDAEVETTTFRLVQEALTNVVKHAEARRVTVEVTERDDVVEITVADDGRGFDAATPPESGFGLLGIQERLAVVRGTVRVESAPGAGTTVRARIPVAPRDGAVVRDPGLTQSRR